MSNEDIRPKLLVVEDDDTNRQTLERIFSKEPYDLRVAADGEVALDIVREDSVDVVLSDLMMPGMDGSVGVQHMVNAYPDVPVVVLSWADGRDNVTNVMNMDARGFIPKTIGSKSLITALQWVLSGKTYVPSIALTSGAAVASTAPRIASWRPR